MCCVSASVRCGDFVVGQGFLWGSLYVYYRSRGTGEQSAGCSEARWGDSGPMGQVLGPKGQVGVTDGASRGSRQCEVCG